MSQRSSLGFRAWDGEPQGQRAEHAHADLELNLVYTGSVTYFHGGRFVSIPPRRLAVLWAAIPHQMTAFEPGTEMAWVTVPLAMALRWQLDESAMARLMQGELLLAEEASDLDTGLARSWAEDGRRGADPQTVELEVQARLRRVMRGGRGAPLAHEAEVVERMAAWLVDHRCEEVAMEDLARAVGLHPKYAATRFREACGMTPWQYLTRLRVAESQRLLLTTGLTVLAIAERAGFGSQARFYAAFRDICGIPPGRWRAEQRRQRRLLGATGSGR